MDDNLFDCAKTYHSLGACVLPLHEDGSTPVQEWRSWLQDEQSLEAVGNFPWDSASGIGLVQGAGDYRCLRVKESSPEVANRLLSALDLPEDYSWVVSRETAVDLWIRSSETSIATHLPEAGAEDGQVQAHWAKGYTSVPPTLLASTGAMEFHFQPPEEPPPYIVAHIAAQAVVDAVNDSTDSVNFFQRHMGPSDGQREDKSENPDDESSALGGQPDPPNSPGPSSSAADEKEVSGKETGTDNMEENHAGDSRQQSPEQKKRVGQVSEMSPDQKSTVQTSGEPSSGDSPSGNHTSGGTNTNGASRRDSEEDGSTSEDFPVPTRASDVEVRSIDWLWNGYIARGMLHMLNGDPGHGKSTLLLTLAARFSKGQTPNGDSIDPINTLYLSAEDQADVTLVPRYRAAMGVDNRLLVVDAADAMDLSLPAHAEELTAVIQSQDIQFCVIDPLFSFLDRDHQKNNEQDVRAVLSELTNVAEATGCAFVLVRHFNKKEDLSAVYRGGGSIGITAQARLGFALAPHPDRPEQERVLAWTKNNLSDKSLREALVFEMNRHPIPKAGEQPTLQYQHTEKWSADELLSSNSGDAGRPPQERQWAEEYLRNQLDDGPVQAADLIDQLDEKEFSESTLRRAKDQLGAESTRKDGKWWWVLPDEEDSAGGPSGQHE